MSELIKSPFPKSSHVVESLSKDHEPPRWIESPHEEREIAWQVHIHEYTPALALGEALRQLGIT